MRTFAITRNGVARIMRTYSLGKGGRVILGGNGGPDAADEIAKWHPRYQAEVTTIRQITKTDIPKEFELKDAWVDDGNAIQTDMAKARVIHMNRIRVVRDIKLAELDTETVKAVGAGDDARRDEVEAEKQSLRDIPQSFDLTKAKTPATLLKLWPGNLET
jgi:hypothetical protein